MMPQFPQSISSSVLNEIRQRAACADSERQAGRSVVEALLASKVNAMDVSLDDYKVAVAEAVRIYRTSRANVVSLTAEAA